MGSSFLGIGTGVLVDAQADARGLKQRRLQLVRLAVLQEVAQDCFGLDVGALLHVAEHGRGEP